MNIKYTQRTNQVDTKYCKHFIGEFNMTSLTTPRNWSVSRDLLTNCLLSPFLLMVF